MGEGGLKKLFGLDDPVYAARPGATDAEKNAQRVKLKKDQAFQKEFYDRVSKMRAEEGPQFRQSPQQYGPTQQPQPQQQFGTIRPPGQPVQTPDFGRNAGIIQQGMHRGNRGRMPSGGLIGGGQ